MLSHLILFIFYTLAMAGILLLAFIVYKKFNFSGKQDNRGIINIVDSCPIGAKKNLLVVKVGSEKFLIASGVEHTTFLAKLNDETIKQLAQTPLANMQEEIGRVCSPASMRQANTAQMLQEPKGEKDIYDFLYTQSKKIENRNYNSNDEANTAQKSYKQNKLKELYETDVQQSAKTSIESRKKLMRELLNEIHQNKTTGSKL